MPRGDSFTMLIDFFSIERYYMSYLVLLYYNALFFSAAEFLKNFLKYLLYAPL